MATPLLGTGRWVSSPQHPTRHACACVCIRGMPSHALHVCRGRCLHLSSRPLWIFITFHFFHLWKKVLTCPSQREHNSETKLWQSFGLILECFSKHEETATTPITTASPFFLLYLFSPPQCCPTQLVFAPSPPSTSVPRTYSSFFTFLQKKKKKKEKKHSKQEQSALSTPLET